ncbi:helix-hairpin-helix domain-containing protein [Alkalicoccus chagannorensis]|uniref:helix-hairpin-helix domain-containing protein n=1 Tax=Alkalicoccus chagannorensis TaxID=427072 RepID=UPI00041ED5A5|nr:helix-hairpin-helix domain-containing protein [Alkalicoccus chagannorensis]
MLEKGKAYMNALPNRWKYGSGAAVILLLWLVLSPDDTSGEIPEERNEETESVLLETVTDEADMEGTGMLMVDVKGEVMDQGTYQLEEGDRVEDAVSAAGGFTEHAAADGVNLAQRVMDEMMIVIPEEGMEESTAVQPDASSEAETSISINQADSAQWQTLPGIGPAKADAIVLFREENGPFGSVEELVEVPGIGEKTLDQLRPYLQH